MRFKSGRVFESNYSSICSTTETLNVSTSDDSLSQIELTASWVLSLSKLVISKMVPEVEIDNKEFLK